MKKHLKHVLSSVGQIEEVLSASRVMCTIPTLGISNLLADFSKSDHGFQIELIQSYSAGLSDKEYNFEISMGTRTFNVHRSFIVRQAHNKRLQSVCSFAVHEFDSSVQDKISFYRAIIPLSNGLDLFGHFASYAFQWENQSTVGLVKLTCLGKSFEIFELTVNNDAYLFLDCMDKTDLKFFRAQCFSILLSIGVITGHFAQVESYVVSATSGEFSDVLSLHYSTHRRSIDCPFDILCTNPYNVVRDIEKANSYRNNLNAVDSGQLSRMVEIIQSEDSIASAAILTLEASTYPLDTQPACLSVALEAIASWTYVKNEERLNPISDKALFKSFRNELVKVLETHKSQIGEDGTEILKKKIESLNSPTNRDRLLSPFKVLGILLTAQDEEAIDKRNAFLHARPIDQNTELGLPENEMFLDFYDQSLRILVLIYRFFFKMAGFKGKLVNVPKLYNSRCKEIAGIPYYIEV